ncbi:unnamed protein product, partial [Prorocentrum cordatum]
MGAAWPGLSTRAACPWAALFSVALAAAPSAGAAAAAAVQTMLEPGISCAQAGLQHILDESLCIAFAEDTLGLDVDDEDEYAASLGGGAYGCVYMLRGRPAVVFSTHGNATYESPDARSICIGSTTPTSTTTPSAMANTTMTAIRNPRAPPPPTTSTFTTSRTRTSSTPAMLGSTPTTTLPTAAAMSAQVGSVAAPGPRGLDSASSWLLAGIFIGSMVSTALFLCTWCGGGSAEQVRCAPSVRPTRGAGAALPPIHAGSPQAAGAWRTRRLARVHRPCGIPSCHPVLMLRLLAPTWLPLVQRRAQAAAARQHGARWRRPGATQAPALLILLLLLLLLLPALLLLLHAAGAATAVACIQLGGRGGRAL